MNVGSETLMVNLRRNPGTPWGFRLQGGADFPTPLSVQMVNPGSVSEMCGLRPGDAVLSINDRPSDELSHEDAKQVIVACGDDVRILVQRGAIKVWKPSVTPMSELRTGQGQTFADPATGFVQKTSLAAERPDVMHIGSTHNRAPKPFGAAPSSYTPMAAPSSGGYGQQDMQGGQNVAAAPPPVAGTRSVRAPITKPPSERQQQQHMLCAVCGSLCVGVFVRIKGNPMHPECFKCATCGKNLKNQGHFDVGGKLYCEDHARQASQPGPDMVATAHYS